MELIWAVLIIVAIGFFLFIILPAMFESPLHTQRKMITQEQTDLNTIRKTRKQIEMEESDEMLGAFYKEAPSTIPVDYPRKQVGSCPYTKAPATDLPLADVPMCMAVQEDNMKLRAI